MTFNLTYNRLVYPQSLQSYSGLTITTPAPVLSILNMENVSAKNGKQFSASGAWDKAEARMTLPFHFQEPTIMYRVTHFPVSGTQDKVED